MTNPDQTTDKYAELRLRCQMVKTVVTEWYEDSSLGEKTIDEDLIDDLLAALDEAEAELGRSREALNEMQGVVESIATGDNECLTRGDFEELAQAALAARKGSR